MMERPEGSGGAAGLLHRLLGERAREFSLEDIPSEDGLDTFEVESSGGQVVLRGSGGVAQTSALYWYLARSCGCQVSWHGDQLSLPVPLPPAERTRVTTPYAHRYYFNYCTFSYSTAFWDRRRWERELDWMALHGINTPLAITGQEAVWRSVCRNLGLTSREVTEFLAGPAYLPFGWMGCLDGWGGPLPERWIDEHAELGRWILERERSFGMRPVLQGFTGHVPRGLVSRYPGSRFHELRWSDFPPTCLLDPLDPLFHDLGRAFLEEQIGRFGTDHLYAADTFIEMTPPSDDPGFVAEVARAIYGAMATADPDAVWVLQAWPFHFRRSFWGERQVRALLDAVPDDRLLVLDLWAEQHPLWRSTRAFHGKPWVWCVLHNFGGRPGLFGRLEEVASGPAAALASPERGHLSGVGMAPEAIEQNPVVYELASEMAWRREPVDVGEWIGRFAATRYGTRSTGAERAWRMLADTVYAAPSDASGALPSVICARPSLERQGAEPYYDPALVAEAWRLLIECAEDGAGGELIEHDLVDVGQQVLSDVARELHSRMCSAYSLRDRESFRGWAGAFLELLRDLDRLLATRPELLLGRWIESARRWGSSDDERRLLEWNARNLITLWGGRDSPLHDYSCRHWSGLVRGFYLPRWEMLISAAEDSLASGEPLDRAGLEERLRTWEEGWTRGMDPQLTQPEGEPAGIARELWRRYSQWV